MLLQGCQPPQKAPLPGRSPYLQTLVLLPGLLPNATPVPTLVFLLHLLLGFFVDTAFAHPLGWRVSGLRLCLRLFTLSSGFSTMAAHWNHPEAGGVFKTPDVQAAAQVSGIRFLGMGPRPQ